MKKIKTEKFKLKPVGSRKIRLAIFGESNKYKPTRVPLPFAKYAKENQHTGSKGKAGRAESIALINKHFREHLGMNPQKFMDNEPDFTDKEARAYIAAAIVSDGHVIGRRIRHYCKRIDGYKFYYGYSIGFSNTNPKIILRLAKAMGLSYAQVLAHLYRAVLLEEDNWQVCYYMRFNYSDTVLSILTGIYPYLTGKQAQAVAIINILTKQHVTEADNERTWKYLRKCNKRGLKR